MDHILGKIEQTNVTIAFQSADRVELIKEVHKTVANKYQVSKVLQMKDLGGYCDINLYMQCLLSDKEIRKFVFKITSFEDDLRTVEIQSELINFLSHAKKEHHKVPELIKSVDGNYIESIQLTFEKGEKIPVPCRLFEFAEGINLQKLYEPESFIHNYSPQQKKLFEVSIGLAVGQLAYHFNEYRHNQANQGDSIHKRFQGNASQLRFWNPINFKHLDFYLDKVQKELTANQTRFFKAVGKLMSERQVIENLQKNHPITLIHSDAGGANIVVGHQKSSPQIQMVPKIWIFDFGDIIISPRVFEIAMSVRRYPLNRKAHSGDTQLLQSYANIIKGFCQIIALKTEEIKSIFLLILVNQVISCVMSKYNQLDGKNDIIESAFRRALQSSIQVLGLDSLENCSSQLIEPRILAAENKFIEILMPKLESQKDKTVIK